MKNKEYYNLNELVIQNRIKNNGYVLVVADKKSKEVAHLEYEQNLSERVVIESAVNSFKNWLEIEHKPLLTGDEIAILTNLNLRCLQIWRDDDGYLFAGVNDGYHKLEKKPLELFSHLFRFIGKGECYNIEKLLDLNKGETK